jgi:hypothetical protein
MSLVWLHASFGGNIYIPVSTIPIVLAKIGEDAPYLITWVIPQNWLDGEVPVTGLQGPWVRYSKYIFRETYVKPMDPVNLELSVPPANAISQSLKTKVSPCNLPQVISPFTLSRLVVGANEMPI